MSPRNPGLRLQHTLVVVAGIAWVSGLVLNFPWLFVLAASTPAVLALGSRWWVILTWVVLSGLTILSYGFNNVPVRIGAFAAPLVDAVLPLAILASARWWLPSLRTPRGKLLLLALVGTSAVALVRLTFDLPRWRTIAVRDSLYVLEAWGVLLGIALGRCLGPERIRTLLGVLWRVAILWFLLYPVRGTLTSVSPIVGIQRPTPLFAWTSAGFIAALAFFWFLQEGNKRLTSTLWATAALVVVLLVQSRGVYLAFGLSLGVLTLKSAHATRRRARVSRLRVVAPVLVALTVLSLIPLVGRLGVPAGPGAVTAQLQTLAGREGPGAGSFSHRLRSWPQVVNQVLSRPGGWLVGIGYGPDLFQGFQVRGGVDVRKPHNDFLEIWGRTGLIGVSFWLLWLGILVWGLFRSRAGPPFDTWAIGLACLTLVIAASQPLFAFAYGGLVFALLAGLHWGVLDARQLQARSRAKPRSVHLFESRVAELPFKTAGLHVLHIGRAGGQQ